MKNKTLGWLITAFALIALLHKIFFAATELEKINDTIYITGFVIIGFLIAILEELEKIRKKVKV